jgi:hypothetical protein
MPRAEWRTFSIRVNARSRKAVGVQAQFPLSEDEWDRLFVALENLRAGREVSAGAVGVSVSARSLERLRMGQVTE